MTKDYTINLLLKKALVATRIIVIIQAASMLPFGCFCVLTKPVKNNFQSLNNLLSSVFLIVMLGNAIYTPINLQVFQYNETIAQKNDANFPVVIDKHKSIANAIDEFEPVTKN